MAVRKTQFRKAGFLGEMSQKAKKWQRLSVRIDRVCGAKA